MLLLFKHFRVQLLRIVSESMTFAMNVLCFVTSLPKNVLLQCYPLLDKHLFSMSKYTKCFWSLKVRGDLILHFKCPHKNISF